MTLNRIRRPLSSAAILPLTAGVAASRAADSDMPK
jgi:hypothetical protein